MWHKITTLAIAIAITGATVAQQQPNDEEAKRAQDAQRLGAAVRDRAAAERAIAERKAVEASLAQIEAERALAERQARQVQDRTIAQQNPNANRAWAGFAAARVTKKEKVTYCGVSTAEPPPVLIEQLKLTRGIGLVVDFVEPGSPAEMAGIKQYDLITKFNDQVLSNPEQLGVLVRLKKVSDDAKLDVIRQGQHMNINVELGQKEIEVEVEQANAAPNFQPRRIAVQPNGQITVAPPMMLGGGGGGMAVMNINGNIQTVWSDDQNTLTLNLQNGKATHLTAKDKTGIEIFNGAVETDDQRKALTPELAEKLKKAEEAGPVRFTTRGLRVGATPRARVLTSTEKDTLLLARFDNGKATHAFAFSTTDGKTLFDGPTVTDDQRKALPEAVAKQLDAIEKNQAAASEFGVVGRN